MTTSRACPLCSTDRRETVFRHATTFAGEQSIFACLQDGMLYASASAADYVEHSSYARVGGTGSGDGDRDRLESTAKLIEGFGIDKDALILDAGCGQGGLLVALRGLGFCSAVGMDPSRECVKACVKRDCLAIHSRLEDLPVATYDLVILSHVLEHIDDVRGALAGVLARLKPNGLVFIEVPDAECYGIYGNPFLDFNSEHINHFGEATLGKMLAVCGLQVSGGIRERIVELANGDKYPVIYALARRRDETRLAMNFAVQSSAMMALLGEHLERELADTSEVILWGAGEYLAHILPLPVFQRVHIAQVVDSNPDLRGRITASGHIVRSPLEIREGLPIIITALIAAPAIRKQIEDWQLRNRVIELRFE